MINSWCSCHILTFLKRTWSILEPSLFPKHAVMWCLIPKMKLVLDIPWFQMGNLFLNNTNLFQCFCSSGPISHSSFTNKKVLFYPQTASLIHKMQHLPSSPNELINEGTAARKQIWLGGTGSSQGCLWPVTFYMTSCGLSEGGKLWAVVSFSFSGGAAVFPARFLHHVLHEWPTFLLLLIPAQLQREKHLFQQPQHPNQPVHSTGRTNMHFWSPPSIFWRKEPDEDDTGLGFPWRMCLASEDGGAMLSAMLMPSRCVPIKMWAGGFPSPLLFLHHLCPLFLGGVWGGLGLFTGVFLPLVELCHSGRRAGVSVGRMGTHCAVPRGKRVSVREMMEMCRWTDIWRFMCALLQYTNELVRHVISKQ